MQLGGRDKVMRDRQGSEMSLSPLIILENLLSITLEAALLLIGILPASRKQLNKPRYTQNIHSLSPTISLPLSESLPQTRMI